MKFYNGAYENKNAEQARNHFLKIQEKQWEDMSSREQERRMNRLYKKHKLAV